MNLVNKILFGILRVKYASFEEVAMLLRDGELPSANELEGFQRVVHERYEVV